MERGSITEMYSQDWRIPKMLLHRILTLAAERGRVLLLYVQDFGGFDPYLLRLMSKKLGIPWDLVDANISIARAFKFEGALGLLEKATDEPSDFALVADPYLHVEHDLRGLASASALTGLLRRLLVDERTVVVFNKTSPNGISPAGGNFHAHSIHALIRLEKRSRGLVEAELVKHPFLPSRVEWFYERELGGAARWEDQPLLSGWL